MTRIASLTRTSGGTRIHVQVLILLLLLGAANAFSARASRVCTTKSCRQQTAVNQVAFPVEEKEMAKEDLANAWTEVEGGFLPNLGLREMILKKRRTRRQLITQVTTLEDYRHEVALADEELVVVKFFAPWCRACKGMAPLYRQLAREYPDIKFVEVPMTDKNTLLFQGLNVRSVPFGHIYHREVGLVEERKMKKKDFRVFAEVLDTYVKRECLLPTEEEEEEKDEHV